jgi:hypothetical protein
MRALPVAVAVTVLAAGCGGAPQAPPQPSPARQSAVRQSPAFPDATASAPFSITRLEACRELRDDLAGNQGVPDIPMLRRIADHVSAPRMAAYARTAVRDIDHTGVAPIPIALFRGECAGAGVRIPAR